VKGEARKTGLWLVLVYEASGNLLAAHGPYTSPENATAWSKQCVEGDTGIIVPLFQPEDVGRD
jgi:hypothetical protein